MAYTGRQPKESDYLTQPLLTRALMRAVSADKQSQTYVVRESNVFSHLRYILLPSVEE
jgi:hypothetical protein